MSFPSLTTLFLLVSTVVTTAQPLASPPTQAESSSDCVEILVSVSPCFPYISAPPNNSSSFPPSQCCEVYSSIVDGESEVCFCYLVADPFLLGFPINTSRILYLPSACPVRNSTLLARNNRSLEIMCADFKKLSPLHSTGGQPVENVTAGPIIAPSAAIITKPDGDETQLPPHVPFQVSSAAKTGGSFYSWVLRSCGRFLSI